MSATGAHLHWTYECDADADTFFATLSTAEIRRRQDLCRSQIILAHAAQNERALTDLRGMEAALTRAMLGRC
jgi:hypothetical protein